jgi:hypothetical protein
MEQHLRVRWKADWELSMWPGQDDQQAHSLLPRKTKSQFIGPYVISHVVMRYS